jgi:hypothetical protein
VHNQTVAAVEPIHEEGDVYLMLLALDKAGLNQDFLWLYGCGSPFISCGCDSPSMLL